MVGYIVHVDVENATELSEPIADQLHIVVTGYQAAQVLVVAAGAD
jgi:hypothetical protein